jgi:hypothetical protein
MNALALELLAKSNTTVVDKSAVESCRSVDATVDALECNGQENRSSNSRREHGNLVSEANANRSI